ncbi:hypothetical protein NV36_08125 [Dokdonia donghaensis DSW-1]|uniref:Uncharacterized protein n=1 Tax=Dokdonia donghaensis DSW-1 TaxID=1300343 RepID=A0A0A2H2G0_9FLAO|nr:hypothetical protein I597_0496 [Dokdonia donghaensis DSW-1]KGO06815.1 hypothetical protein NV36_08125 [Dokdonia donghaensis DSW-1]
MCICALLLTSVSRAQVQDAVKAEREYRIKPELVPQKAKDFIATFNIDRSVKWLQEVGDDGASIEAKFKYKGQRHSVEFTKDGVLQDVEIVIGLGDVSEDTRQEITSYFAQEFDYFKVEKIQAQYNNTVKEIINRTAKKLVASTLIPHYEVVVKTRYSGKKSKRYEVLFNEKGAFISRSQISIRRDNILRF